MTQWGEKRVFDNLEFMPLVGANERSPWTPLHSDQTVSDVFVLNRISEATRVQEMIAEERARAFIGRRYAEWIATPQTSEPSRA